MDSTIQHHSYSRWEQLMDRVAARMDAAAQRIASIPGRFIERRKDCSAGIFFYPRQPSFWAVWVEPGAFNVRLGRLEIQLDRPSKL